MHIEAKIDILISTEALRDMGAADCPKHIYILREDFKNPTLDPYGPSPGHMSSSFEHAQHAFLSKANCRMGIPDKETAEIQEGGGAVEDIGFKGKETLQGPLARTASSLVSSRAWQSSSAYLHEFRHYSFQFWII